MHRTTRAALLAIGSWVALAHADAQTREVPRPRGDRPPFEAAVNALGMERGVRREQTAINAIFFVAKGSLASNGTARTVDRAVLSMSYFVPAIRMDVTWRAGAKTEREIQVANGALAWNESEPGIGATPTSESAAERLRQIWLTPQGAMRALVNTRAKNKDAVTIAQVDGRTTFSAQFEGAPFEVTVDAEHRPQRVRWTLDGKVHEAEFRGYKDWELLDVFFPQRIVQRIDGRVVADLTVTDFRSNPYVVFPVPAAMRGKT